MTSGHNFNETGNWARFCRTCSSIAMPGVEDFYGWLAGRHPSIRVFFVTSRLDALRQATADNLLQIRNVPAGDAASPEATKTSLFMQKFEVNLPNESGSDKHIQYRYIEQVLGYETILRLGDNASDFHAAFSSKIKPAARLAAAEKFAQEWGRRWIQFPNPVYGGFLQSLRNTDGTPITEDEGTAKGMTDEAVRKPCTLETTPKVEFLNPWSGT